jgi:hypothetical protein
MDFLFRQLRYYIQNKPVWLKRTRWELGFAAAPHSDKTCAQALRVITALLTSCAAVRTAGEEGNHVTADVRTGGGGPCRKMNTTVVDGCQQTAEVAAVVFLPRHMDMWTHSWQTLFEPVSQIAVLCPPWPNPPPPPPPG